MANDDSLQISDPRLHLQEVSKVGKKAAGRLFDGGEHNGMPALCEPKIAIAPRQSL